MFGDDWGSWIAQLVVTVAVILALIAVVYWLVRRYSTGGLGRIGRGRVPRLAIVDAMPVDGRRRLVLVRRDSVEHLILIGGPSDVVVEHSIQRRQRTAMRSQQQQPVAPSVEPPPGRTEPAPVPVSAPGTGGNPPIPFAAGVRSQGQAGVSTIPSDRSPIHTPRRNAPQPAPVAAAQAGQTVENKAVLPENPAPAEGALPSDVENAPHPIDSAQESPNPFAAPPSPADAETAAKVNDLEREMARLLGEITAKPAS
jgi:flagellar biogenesis protein FliO